jgi:hypothetical protein
MITISSSYEPSSQRENRHLATRQAEHHHRTGVDQPVTIPVMTQRDRRTAPAV